MLNKAWKLRNYMAAIKNHAEDHRRETMGIYSSVNDMVEGSGGIEPSLPGHNPSFESAVYLSLQKFLNIINNVPLIHSIFN